MDNDNTVHVHAKLNAHVISAKLYMYTSITVLEYMDGQFFNKHLDI